MIRPIPEACVSIRQMRHEDLAHVSDIERRSYDFPWSHGVFRDCLLAGYQCVVLERNGELAGYGILSVAAGEAHILNLCIEPAYRSCGYGERLLDEILFRARTSSVREIFLEVRPSNANAIALYKKKGFHQVANRPAYYQSRRGREDAAVLSKKLTTDD
ncbi:MAG: ribosomal protein S18-alanine N-acetyltransferase [Gammaproteobacteria bacterium]|nr:ribosomal protein S18-alanine N-acetyltransferase [Gammaproteobacteria bacterium]MDH3372877.1 ribosomal protein S18-alanine N-acetyltransferase [Gammaproteobacteria bacterium]MDH3407950.1 ribosomal protein S18-alanine N-acetyltransferase [Gammaproteobacteria bacterium]MDH3551624.1 ribosomal protein S18-alanine N-acetyltransferase [Gammaproteobacteria bacterium]